MGSFQDQRADLVAQQRKASHSFENFFPIQPRHTPTAYRKPRVKGQIHEAREGRRQRRRDEREGACMHIMLLALQRMETT